MGQLGPAGRAAFLSMPTDIDGIDDAVEVSQRDTVTCVRHASGDVSCLGDNSFGELGNGTTSDRQTSNPTPQRVVGLHDAVQLAVDSHGTACARRANRHISCWGANDAGQLGNGTMLGASTPVDVALIDDAVDLVATRKAVCALRASGGVWCWGSDAFGVVGRGAVTYRPTPVDVVGDL